MAGTKLTIAIDGPAGAGKSTVAREVARLLAYTYVDSGAMYRAATLHCLRAGVDVRDAKQVGTSLRHAIIELTSSCTGTPQVFLNGEDVSRLIRSSDISQTVSYVSRHQIVRNYIVGILREQSVHGGLVMDGRDIGTVVLPDADLKFFLTASPEIRAVRRHRQLIAQGEHLPYDDVLTAIVKRDSRDTSRDTAPLRPAQDAVVIDTTHQSVDQVVGHIVAMCRERGAVLCSTR